MSDEKQPDGGKDTDPGAGYYPNDVPDHLVSSNGGWRLVMHDDGSVEVRHAGSHVRNL